MKQLLTGTVAVQDKNPVALKQGKPPGLKKIPD